MVVYSIKDLEELSGVKAHTIRIWEKRYNIIEPKRTPSNIRYYHEDDLKRLINISILNKNGIKISKIALMTPQQIRCEVAKVSKIEVSNDQLDSLTLSLLDLNEEKINLILDKKIEKHGFVRTMLEVIYPLLDRIAVLWVSGSIRRVHERFISNLIRRKCAAMIDKTQCSRECSFLIYLPEGEANDLSLLFLHYLIADKGFKVVNLGSEVQIEDLIAACDTCHPQYVYTIINDSMSPEQMALYIKKICNHNQEGEVWLSGLCARDLTAQLPSNSKVIPSSIEVMEQLERISASDS